MSRPSVVDLSRLAPPDVIETLSFEAVVAALKADFTTRWDARRAGDPTLPEIDVLDLETDPITIAFEAAAFRELLLRARVNDAARSTLVAFASGSDLDHIGAAFGVKRLVVRPAVDGSPAVMESDKRLRRRVQLAPEAYGTAGAEGAYVYYALTAAPTIADATAVQTAPGEVLITTLGASAVQPSSSEIEAVQAVVNRRDVRPLTDSVAVAGPIVKQTTIDATLTLYPGPSAAAVATEARRNLAAWLAENRALGRDLTRSSIIARLFVEGVQTVRVDSPATDIGTAATDVVAVTDVTVRVGGRDE